MTAANCDGFSLISFGIFFSRFLDKRRKKNCEKKEQKNGSKNSVKTRILHIKTKTNINKLNKWIKNKI